MTALVDRPLAGKTVLVTRPAAQAEALAAPLRELGAAVELIPSLEILPPMDRARLTEAVHNLTQYDWLVLTSVNGVAALEREMVAQRITFDEVRANVAVVGLATGDAMIKLGRLSRIVPETFNAERLALRMAGEVGGKRVLLLQGAGAASTMQDGLLQAGARVDRVEAYRAGEPPTLGKQLGMFLRSGIGADAVTFTSAQMALNFYRALEAKCGVLPESTVVASIGPVTSSALRALGKTVDVEAKEPRMESMAVALGAYFSQWVS